MVVQVTSTDNLLGQCTSTNLPCPSCTVLLKRRSTGITSHPPTAMAPRLITCISVVDAQHDNPHYVRVTFKRHSQSGWQAVS